MGHDDKENMRHKLWLNVEYLYARVVSNSDSVRDLCAWEFT